MAEENAQAQRNRDLDVFLEPKLVVTMALMFHELATNTAKYGSPFGSQRQVSIRWSVQNST